MVSWKALTQKSVKESQVPKTSNHLLVEKYGLPNITVKQSHLSQGRAASVIPSGDLAGKHML